VNGTPFEMPTLLRQSVLLESDRVRILDRRIFPFEMRFVDCRTVEDVACAIEAMVTQSGGPFYAASAGMVLAARMAQGLVQVARREMMQASAKRLIATRHTNNLIAYAVGAMLAEAEARIAEDAFAAGMETAMHLLWESSRAQSRQVGEHAATQIHDGDTVLTHCWGESAIIEPLAAALRAGKRIKVICTETRPYLQGSRLTAHSIAEMGIDVTVITDNMGAWAMDRGRVSRLITAADRVTMSGHVVNKVGTLQLALAAHAYGLPYIATVQDPDRKAPGPQDVPMEDRDPNETLHCLGRRTASPLAHGWYPAFDITPPHLVTAIATTRGIFPADQMEQHYAV
jgi:methylthioribose-1-phosphate isomerase